MQKILWYSKSSFVMNCSLQRFTPTPGGGKRHHYKMGPEVSWSWGKVDWVDSLRKVVLLTLPKTNKTLENPAFEDAFPIENGDFSNVILIFRGF